MVLARASCRGSRSQLKYRVQKNGDAVPVSENRVPVYTGTFMSADLNFVCQDRQTCSLHDSVLGKLLGVICIGAAMQYQAAVLKYQLKTQDSEAQAALEVGFQLFELAAVVVVVQDHITKRSIHGFTCRLPAQGEPSPWV